MIWHVYLIECEDDSIYTGITVDVAKRYAAHCAGKGAKYTRARKPRQLLMSFPQANQSTALKTEHAIKQLSASQKRALTAESIEKLIATPSPQPLLSE